MVPLHIGTSPASCPSVAMTSEVITIGKRKMHIPGTLIGKALELLEIGSGKILVLPTLR